MFMSLCFPYILLFLIEFCSNNCYLLVIYSSLSCYFMGLGYVASIIGEGLWPSSLGIWMCTFMSINVSFAGNHILYTIFHRVNTKECPPSFSYRGIRNGTLGN